jgi:hypothetical protein
VACLINGKLTLTQGRSIVPKLQQLNQSGRMIVAAFSTDNLHASLQKKIGSQMCVNHAPAHGASLIPAADIVLYGYFSHLKLLSRHLVPSIFQSTTAAAAPSPC